MQLVLSNLVKFFGDKEVLHSVSFTADSGKAMGLLGRNGAGKTTTIRIIMNVFPPDQGDVLLDGRLLRHSDIRIGYMPEEKGLYPKIKIKDQLTYLAELRGLSRNDARKSVRYWLERLEMTEYLDKKLETLSKGNQQKIQLAVALLSDPEIVILDEPFSGLDPVNAQLLKDVVNEQVAQSKIVLFSSHQMNYVETFCDDVAILHGGEITLHGNIREIKRAYPRNRLAITLSDGSSAQAWPAERVQTWLTGLAGQSGTLRQIIDRVECVHETCQVVLHQSEQRDQLLHELVKMQASIEQFSIVEPTLEDIFIEKTGNTELDRSSGRHDENGGKS